MEPLKKVFVKAKRTPLAKNFPRRSNGNMPDDALVCNAFTKGDETAFIKIYTEYFTELCDFGLQCATIDRYTKGMWDKMSVT